MRKSSLRMLAGAKRHAVAGAGLRAVARAGLGAGLTVAAAAALVAGSAAAVPAASADQMPGTAAVNPYSPAAGHTYRHGVVPTRQAAAKMRSWAAAHPAAARGAAAASPNDLSYGGGIDGIGVTTGQEKVYLVFYGSQWGTSGTNGNGNTTLSGDHSGEAPYLQQLFKGLGTRAELWSGVMTQYCEGVAGGAQSCPAGAAHVAYPTAPPLAGVWVDEAAASPHQATGHQLALEAIRAAGHFGNTTAAANRDAQYDIVSPPGTNPDGFNTPSGQFCAWHDDNADTTLSGGAASSPYGDIAFTNMPYETDAGASCGQGFVNSPGTLDGVSIVGGHEYAETITDQNPPGGWTDSAGAENGDKCAWISPGTSGGSFDLPLTTGTFAMQTTWANDGAGGQGSCEASHPIAGGGGGGGTPTGPITSGMAGKCVDDFHDGVTDRTKVDLYSCNGTAAQRWAVMTDGTLRINGKCMDITHASTANGAKIEIFTCSGGWNQVWRPAAGGELVNPHSGKCLDDPGFSTTNGVQLEIWACNGGSNQRWTLP
jgi:Ricin-type beta-trefoil lectin domain